MRKGSSQLLVVSSQNKSSRRRREHGLPAGKAGFTLLELIIVIAILSILSVAVVLVINPAEMLRRARDSQRLSDLAALSSAINLAAVEQSSSGSWNPSIYNGNDGCIGDTNQHVFISIPTSVEVVSDDDLPTGWTYVQRADPSAAGQVNGNGWVPVDLTSGGGNSPLSNLPQDPVNSFADNAYYTYACTRNPTFELTARMESNRYRTGGSQDKSGGDGGDDPFVYEVGSNLGIDPKAPIAYWDAASWDGTDTIPDSSGNGHDAVAVGGGATIPTPGSDATGTYLTFDGGDYLEVPDNPELDFAETDARTVLVSFRWAAAGGGSIATLVAKKTNILNNAGWGTWIRRSDGQVQARPGDGSSSGVATSGGSKVDANTLYVAAERFTSTNTVQVYFSKDGTYGNPATWTPSATLANADALRIGRLSGAAGGYMDGDIYAVGLWHRALTDQEIASISEALRS